MMRDADVMTGEELGNKLLESVRQMKRGEAARETQVEVPKAAEVRHRMGLSQKEFADLLDVSLGTLRGWEQGRREPTGTARTLLRVAEKHPEALRDLA
ncbi:helix-turn-helix domain-containing protein [Halomonas sp. NO4]|uniref:helix-turn-helix domain-containing protein n=1 Tax=Halomonas sp. NO4 TaxID=2484813 RepID=UPI001F09B077|nr:helix-turn-helix domain-containing protein [Halomonas sp. NO4]